MKPILITLISLTVGMMVACSSSWDAEFSEAMQRTNNAMIAPVNAISELYICETQEQCDIALENLPPALDPAVVVLRQEITTIESLKPSSGHEALHSSYLQTLNLRLEAFESYIAGIRDNNETLLDAGDDALTRAQNQHITTLGLMSELFREEDDMSEEGAWVMEWLALQQRFLQNESNVGPALEAYIFCETVKQCEMALSEIPSALRPGQASFAQLLDTLKNLAPPGMLVSCSRLQSLFYEVMLLRFEAYGLFIRGAEETNNNLLDEAYRTYAQSTQIGDDFFASYEDCMESIQ